MDLIGKCCECRYQGIVENFVEEDENGEFNYVCPDCDSPKIVEAKLKASWQKSFAGRKIDLEKALASGWHDQGSEKFLYGVKQQKNIWAKIVKPAQQSCHEIWIFIILKVNDDQAIEDVDYRVDQVFPDDHSETLQVELWPDDRNKAVDEITNIIEK